MAQAYEPRLWSILVNEASEYIARGRLFVGAQFWDTTTPVPPTHGHSPASYFSSSSFAFTAVSISWYSFGSDFSASLAASRPCAS
jgi:hypothetical protein